MSANNGGEATVDVEIDKEWCKPLDETGLLGSSQRVAMASWNDCIDQLHAFRSLEDDWDGCGASAPEAALIEGAINLAHSLRQKRFIAPDRVQVSPDGTVLFEFFGNGREYLEFEVISRTEAEQREVAQDSSVTEQLVTIA